MIIRWRYTSADACGSQGRLVCAKARGSPSADGQVVVRLHPLVTKIRLEDVQIGTAFVAVYISFHVKADFATINGASSDIVTAQLRLETSKDSSWSI